MRYVVVAATTALAVSVADGLWLGLWTLGWSAAGEALGIVVVLGAGANAGARLPGVRGWLTLLIGGAIGSVLTVNVLGLLTQALVSRNPWLTLGIMAFIPADFLAVGLLGSLGWAYWVASRALVRRAVLAKVGVAVQLAGLVCIGLLVSAMATANVARPDGVTEILVRNGTSATLRFHEHVDGSWRQLGASFDLAISPGGSDILIADPDPRMGTAPGGIDTRGCTTREIVARDPGGTDIAVHPPGLCDGETWVITAAGTNQ